MFIGVGSGDLVGGDDNSYGGVKLFLTIFPKISTKSKKIWSIVIDSLIQIENFGASWKCEWRWRIPRILLRTLRVTEKRKPWGYISTKVKTKAKEFKINTDVTFLNIHFLHIYNFKNKNGFQNLFSIECHMFPLNNKDVFNEFKYAGNSLSRERTRLNWIDANHKYCIDSKIMFQNNVLCQDIKEYFSNWIKSIYQLLRSFQFKFPFWKIQKLTGYFILIFQSIAFVNVCCSNLLQNARTWS